MKPRPTRRNKYSSNDCALTTPVSHRHWFSWSSDGNPGSARKETSPFVSDTGVDDQQCHRRRRPLRIGWRTPVVHKSLHKKNPPMPRPPRHRRLPLPPSAKPRRAPSRHSPKPTVSDVAIDGFRLPRRRSSVCDTFRVRLSRSMQPPAAPVRSCPPQDPRSSKAVPRTVACPLSGNRPAPINGRFHLPVARHMVKDDGSTFSSINRDAARHGKLRHGLAATTRPVPLPPADGEFSVPPLSPVISAITSSSAGGQLFDPGFEPDHDFRPGYFVFTNY